MRYALKGLLQFKGVFHIIKIPFSAVGLGNAMTPWLTENLINKVSEELIIKTQSLVTIGKTDGENSDVFLIDVLPGNFNEAYRQNCVDILTGLVRKHLIIEESDIPFNSTLSMSKPKNQDSYEFFNPNTALNLLKAKFSNENYVDASRVNAFITYLKKIAADISNKSQVVYCVEKEGFSVYSLNAGWVSTYGAQEVQLNKFFTEFGKDLMGKEHTLGKYFFNLDASQEMWEQMALRNGLIAKEGDPDADGSFYQTLRVNVASAVMGRFIDMKFPEEIRTKLRDSFFCLNNDAVFKDFNCEPIMKLCLYKNYDYGQGCQFFLQQKDLIIKELSLDYFDNIKENDFEKFDKDLFKTFFRENIQNTSDGALYLKSALFEFISSLMFVKTQKALSIFEFIKSDILDFFDLYFNRSISMEFPEVDTDEMTCTNFFGIKVVQTQSNDEPVLKNIIEDLSVRSQLKEFYVCKPENAENLEVLFFNDSWDVELKRKLITELKEKLFG